MPESSINWGSVADWVSGIGSLSAAGIALFLARASERIRLTGYVGTRVVVGGGMPMVDLVSISVTNVGTRATVINNIGFSVGRFKKKRQAIITVVRDAYSDGVPFALADGQKAHWGIPIGTDKKWLREVCEGMIRTEEDLRTLRFHVYTTHGAKLTIRPEEGLLKALREVLAEPSAKVGSGTPAGE